MISDVELETIVRSSLHELFPERTEDAHGDAPVGTPRRHRFTRLVAVAAAVVLVVAAALVTVRIAHRDTGGNHASSGRTPVYHGSVQTTRSVAAGRASLRPPGAHPVVLDPAAAFATWCRVTHCERGRIAPLATMRLGRLTTVYAGRRTKDGTFTPVLNDRLSYVLTWTSHECLFLGGPIPSKGQTAAPQPSGVTCRWTVPIDAATGHPLGFTWIT